MSDIDHDDGPDFPGDIASMAQKENAVEIIHRLVMDVSRSMRDSMQMHWF